MLFFFFSAGISHAVDISLSWDKNNEADYYVIYWGDTSGNYTQQSEPVSSDVTSFTALNLEDKTWYFAMKALNNCGQSSDLSSEVVYESSSVVDEPESNTLPVANAGPDISVDEGEAVSLNGVLSSDSDGTIESYQWQVSPDSYVLDNNNTATANFTSPEVDDNATLTITLTVTDNDGGIATDTCMINIINTEDPNTPPVASAGADISVNEDDNVTLNGGSSSDSDGTIASYSWVQKSGTTVTVNDADKAVASFKAPNGLSENTALVFELTVTDNSGTAHSDTCIVNIMNAKEPNMPPVADAGSDLTVEENSTVRLVGTGSSDTDGTISSYSWVQTGGKQVALTNANTATPTFSAPDPDSGVLTLTFVLTVTDDTEQSHTDSCIVNVVEKEADQFPPVANAGSDQTVTSNTTVSLSGGQSSDLDGSIVSYLWQQQGGTVVVLDSSGSMSPSFTAPEVLNTSQVLTFQVTVTDDIGLMDTDTCIVNITAVESQNTPPVANAGDDKIATGGDAVALNGGDSYDSDSGTLSYQWRQTEGLAVELSGSTSNQLSFTVPTEISFKGDTLVFLLTVRDDKGLTATDECHVILERKAETISTVSNPPADESVLVSASESPSIEVFDTYFRHLAWLKIGWNDYNAQSGEARVATGDIDGDGEDEIIIGLSSVDNIPEIPGGYFEIIDDDYTHIGWGQVGWQEYNEINGETWPTCGDLNGDGVDEIVVGLGLGGNGVVEIFEFTDGKAVHSQWLLSSWESYNEIIGETHPVCGDIDNDGKDEVLMGFGNSSEINEDLSGYFELVDDTLEHLAWGKIDFDDYRVDNGESWPTFGDINGDGQLEVVIGLGKGGGGNVEIFNWDQSELTHMAWAVIDWEEYNATLGETRPVCSDIDADGKDEIIVGLGSVEEDTEVPDGFFQVLDDDFTVMSWGQIEWTAFNKVDGASRPMRGMQNGTEKIIMGLGKIVEMVSDDDTGSESGQDHSPIAESGESGSGCFIRSVQ